MKSIFGITKCSATDWALWICYVLITIIMTIYVMVGVRSEHDKKKRAGYIFGPDENMLDYHGSIVISMISLFTGILSSSFGISGALIFTPILLQLGFIPEVGANTVMFVVLWKSVATIFLFAFEGDLPIGHMIVFNVYAIAATIGSTYWLLSYIKRTGKSMIIALFLGILLVFCSISLPSYGIYKEFSKNASHMWDFKAFCP